MIHYKKIKLFLSLLLLSILTGGMASADSLTNGKTDVPPEMNRISNRAQRSTDDYQNALSYYKYSRYRNIAQPQNDISVETKKEESEKGELQFEVKEIRVTPSKLLSQEDIVKAIHFKGAGPMTVTELNDMVDRLNALYAEKGILTAQAVLPPQKVQDGIVYIRLIEGAYGKTIVTGNQRIAEDTLLHRIQTVHGELVNIDELQDQLRTYNSTNTYQVQAQLVPGDEEGTSDVLLTLEEPENPVTSFIFADNAGQKESGRYRIGAYSEYRGIGGHDASLAVTPVWTEGTWGGSIMYDTPWGHHGTRASISYSRNLVDIIDGAFKDFDMKANSNDVALSITHPLHITELSKVDAFLEGHRKWSDTTYAGMPLADNETRTIKAGISARSFDENGLWFAMASVTGYQNDNRIREEDNNGSYYSGYLMRRQNLPGDRYLMYRLYGQYTAFQELPSTEQFSLGGMSSIRGFKEGLLSGDKGWVLGWEYGFPLSSDHQTWRSFLFLDHGVSYNNFSTAGTQKDFLTSTGLGLEYSKNGWYGKVVYGIPLNHSEQIESQHPRIHFYLQRNL